MLRRSWVRRIVAFVAVSVGIVGALVVIGPEDAGSVPKDEGSCYGSTIKYKTSGPYGSDVDLGLTDWEQVKNPFGAKQVNFVKTSGTPDLTVFVVGTVWVNGLPTSLAGHFDCVAKTIQVKNLGYGPHIRMIAGHEAGHAIDMKHTGRVDSHDYKFPYMSTCGTLNLSFAQDDYSNLIFTKFSSSQPVHANHGFERSSYKYWTRQNVSSAISSINFTGNKSALWRPNNSNHALYNDATFVSTLNDRDVDIRAVFKTPVVPTEGVIRLTYQNWQATYGSPSPPDCPYINNWDLNNKSAGAPYIFLDEIRIPAGTGWSVISANKKNYPGEGTIARIILTSSLKKSGQFSWIHVDDATVRNR